MNYNVVFSINAISQPKNIRKRLIRLTKVTECRQWQCKKFETSGERFRPYEFVFGYYVETDMPAADVQKAVERIGGAWHIIVRPATEEAQGQD